MSVTYYVVVPFSMDDGGNLAPLEAQEAPNAEAARCQARLGAAKHGGAIALSRVGNLIAGDFGEAVILAVYGEVDVDMLAE